MKRISCFLLTIAMLMTFNAANSNAVYAADFASEFSLETDSETEPASNIELSIETETLTEAETVSETESSMEDETIQESENMITDEMTSEFIQENQTVLEDETASEMESESEYFDENLLEELESDTECYYGDEGFNTDGSSTVALPRRSSKKSQTGKYRDTVLVLDASSSMKGKPNAVMKAAAIKFCSKVLESDGINRVAVVVYNSNVVGRMNFSDDLNQLTKYINSIGASGQTNVSSALAAAKNLLDTSNNSTATKNIVLLSDGKPEGGNKQENGKYNLIGPGYSYPYANAAYSYFVQNLKNDYNVYTLGFFHTLKGTSYYSYVQQFMTDIQNKGYYEVTNVDELEFTFGDVAEDIINDDSNCPIIIVPGIMGSQLYSGTTKVWANIGLIFNPVLRLDQYMAMTKTVNVHNYNLNSA